MKKSPIMPLQEAVDTILNTIPGLTVYNSKPTNGTFPYTYQGEKTGISFDTKTSDGTEVTTTHHIWSNLPDSNQCEVMMDRVINKVMTSTIEIQGFEIESLNVDFMTILQEKDETSLKHHGVVRFRYIIEEV